MPSGRTCSRSSSRASSPRRWTTTGSSPSRASTSRTSTRSTSRPPTASSSRATRTRCKVELQDYLAEHARRESYVLLSPPKVLLETDDDLAVGEFGIATRMVQRQPERRRQDALPSGPARRDDGLPKPASRPEAGLGRRARPSSRGRRAHHATDTPRHEIDKRRMVIGRSKDCDIQLADPNVSRRHAELRQEGTAYWIVDLGSTNGIEVNGRPLKRAKLEDGDRIVARLDRARLRARGRRDCVGSLSGRGGPAPAQGRVSRAPLPVHLADRPQRQPRPARAAESFVLAPSSPRAALLGWPRRPVPAGRRQEPGAQTGANTSSTPRR